MTKGTRKERANGRRYAMHMAGASVLYLVMLLVPPLFVEADTVLGKTLAVLPVIPVVWMLFAVVQFVRNLDEYFRPRMVTSMAIGFAAAMLAAVVVGMLEGAIGVIPLSSWIIFVTGMLVWAISVAVISARGARDAR